VTAERLIAGNMTGMNSIVGHHVVVLCNLKERAFLGISSGAMLLFSTDESTEVSSLLTVQPVSNRLKRVLLHLIFHLVSS
jgi:tRNA-binding EMAP/Myf-like protein